VLRLETFYDGRQRVQLLTNVLDKAKLPRRAMRKMYRRRCKLELYYRSLKQTMAKRKLLSDSPRHAAVELDWCVASLWILGLMTVAALVESGQLPGRGVEGGARVRKMLRPEVFAAEVAGGDVEFVCAQEQQTRTTLAPEEAGATAGAREIAAGRCRGDHAGPEIAVGGLNAQNDVLSSASNIWRTSRDLRCFYIIGANIACGARPHPAPCLHAFAPPMPAPRLEPWRGHGVAARAPGFFRSAERTRMSGLRTTVHTRSQLLFTILGSSTICRLTAGSSAWSCRFRPRPRPGGAGSPSETTGSQRPVWSVLRNVPP
jgi:hypothetical protein